MDVLVISGGRRDLQTSGFQTGQQRPGLHASSHLLKQKGVSLLLHIAGRTEDDWDCKDK